MRIVIESGKPVAQVAKELKTNETTPASWVSQARRSSGAGRVGERGELARLRRENAQLKKASYASPTDPILAAMPSVSRGEALELVTVLRSGSVRAGRGSCSPSR